jgi:phosphoribosylanthranilate isomerase
LNSPVHVTGPEAVVQAQEVASTVDAVLLDSGNPLLEVKELGGTGRRHDWAISARIRDLLPVPVFLAGGLDPANVTEAVRVVRPYALDVCSRLRVGGRLDSWLMEAFFDAVRQPGGASKRDRVMHTW